MSRTTKEQRDYYRQHDDYKDIVADLDDSERERDEWKAKALELHEHCQSRGARLDATEREMDSLRAKLASRDNLLDRAVGLLRDCRNVLTATEFCSGHKDLSRLAGSSADSIRDFLANLDAQKDKP